MNAPIPTDDFSNSWIVTRRADGRAIGEFFRRSTVEKIDQTRYRIETAGQYLARVNDLIRRGTPGPHFCPTIL